MAQDKKQYYQTHKAEYVERDKRWKARHPLYPIWLSMKARCFNPKRKDYKYYGGRGITVCDEWLVRSNFEKWVLENGWQKGLSIDRIDDGGNYCPENCQIITKSDNNKKRAFHPLHGIDGRFIRK